MPNMGRLKSRSVLTDYIARLVSTSIFLRCDSETNPIEINDIDMEKTEGRKVKITNIQAPFLYMCKDIRITMKS